MEGGREGEKLQTHTHPCCRDTGFQNTHSSLQPRLVSLQDEPTTPDFLSGAKILNPVHSHQPWQAQFPEMCIKGRADKLTEIPKPTATTSSPGNAGDERGCNSKALQGKLQMFVTPP